MKWTNTHQLAAHLVADDKISDEEIAATCDVKRITIARWRLEPEFIAAVQAIKEQTAKALLKQGIALKQNRIDGYVKLFQKLEEVIEARAVAGDLMNIPGGKSGLITAEMGPGGVTYKVDHSTITAMLNVSKQTAQELGEWVEKSDNKTKHDGSVALRVTRDLSRWTDEELHDAERLADKLADEAGNQGREGAA